MKLLHRHMVFAYLCLLLISCKPSAKKIENAAAEYCTCMKKSLGNLGGDTKRLVKNAAEANDPAQYMQEAMMELDSAKLERVREEFLKLGALEQDDSELGACVRKVDIRYRSAFSLDEEATALKVAAELEKKPGCELMASLIKLGIKVNDE
jgi:hypothetical protein